MLGLWRNSKYKIPSTLVESKGQCGGGAIPGKEIDSFALRIDNKLDSNKKKSEFAEKLYFALMKHQSPVVSVLRKGDVYLDVLTVPEEQFEKLSKVVKEVYSQIEQ